MKKNLLTLCALLTLGVSGAWADDITWESTDATTDGINAYGFGITLPDVTGIDADKAYNVSSFNIQLRGSSNTKALYMAIATEAATSATISASKIIAISTLPASAGVSSFSYEFKDLTLFKGVTYHVHFFLTDTPTDGAFTEQQQGIKVGTTSTSNPLGTVGVYYTNYTDKWPPIFSAKLNEGMPISPSTGNYTNKTGNGNWASKWTSGCKAPALQLSTANQYIKTADGAIYSGSSKKSTYTISVPGYLITGYKIKGQALVADKNQTITPVDDSEHPVVFTSAAENAVNISGIEKTSTTFTLAGENNGMSISEFRVYVKRDPNISTLVSTLKTNMDTYKDLSGVGYPKSNAAERTNLNSAYSEINSYTGSTEDYIKCINYAGQLDAYNNYLASTDIEMPTDGKVYTFVNRQSDGKLWYLYDNSSTSKIELASCDNIGDVPVSGQFICHLIDATHFSFVSKRGNYMVWTGRAASDPKGVGNTTQDGLLQVYNTSYCPQTLCKFLHSSASVEDFFGTIAIRGARDLSNAEDTKKNSYWVVNYAGTFNAGDEMYYKANNYTTAFYITEVSDYYNKVKLTSDGTDAYSSVYLPFSVTIPSGVTAYAVTEKNSSYVTLGAIAADGGTLPKEQAAILKKAGQTENETIYLSPATEAGTYTGENLLRGTVEANQATPSNTYVLGNADGFIGLYPYTGTNLARGKAYIDMTGFTSVKALTFNYGDLDAIEALNAEQSAKEQREIFDLSGCRISNPIRGLYIIDGKKVVVK